MSLAIVSFIIVTRIQDGESISLRCNIPASSPSYDISWVKLSEETASLIDGNLSCSDPGSGSSGIGLDVDIESMLLQNAMVVANRSDLNFTSLTYGDEGLYVCTLRRSDVIQCYSSVEEIAGEGAS